MVIVETKNLTKTYGEGETAVEALKKVNLKIHQGEFIAVVGASGSGKTTLLNLLGGLDYPTDGSVLFNGTDIYELDDDELTVFRRNHIGFVFQHFNLLPMLTVEENICLPLELGKNPVDREFFQEVVELLGIAKKSNYFPGQLSGGQQQRVAIARALLTKPMIVLADEPTGNLDSKTSSEVMELLERSLKKYNQTLVMITHNPEIAQRADCIIELEDGMIV